MNALSRRGHRQSERGAILVLSALLITALLVIVAIVIDLGATRSDRRGGQVAVDNAAAAAGKALADPAEGPVTACTESIAYLNAVLDTTFTVTSTRTCADFATACTAGGVVVSTDPVIATADGGKYIATVQYPVIDSSPLMARTSTIGAASLGAPTSADGAPCKRIGVQLQTTEDGYFGGVASAGDRTSTVHAVATGSPGTTGVGIPAFLMLERVDCGSLVDNNAAGIYVRESLDGTAPGTIHVDSYATGDCSGSTKGYAVYGKAQSDGTTSIRVYPSTVPPVENGSINVVASNARAGAEFPAGLSVAPTTGANAVSRAPVDTKYNSTGSTAITDLHTSAYGALTAAASSYTVAAGWETVDCTTNPTGLFAKVYVNCATFDRTAIFPASVSEVVFSGKIEQRADRALTVNATRVTVKGMLDLPKGTATFPRAAEVFVGGGVNVSNNGALSVNSVSPTTCIGGTSSATRFAIFGASSAALVLDGSSSLCSTAAYLAGPLTATNAAYVKQALSAGSPHASCTVLKPCPKGAGDGNTAAGATFSLGGGVIVTWTAPNEYPGSFSGPQGVEDLALWMEGATAATVGSGAELKVTGVVFAPNARVEMRSPASAVPRNAQFISRSLWLYQGNLSMRPVAGNVVDVPAPGTSSLIR